jgi:hypothetical protein
MNRPLRRIPVWLVLSAIALLCAPTAGEGSGAAGTVGFPLTVDNNTLIDVNNIAMYVTNSGGFARNLEAAGGPSGLYFPRGTDKTAVYAAGLWFGCTVAGEVRVTVAEYDLEYQPGTILRDSQNRPVPASPGDPRFYVYKLVKGDTLSADYIGWRDEASQDGAPVDQYGRPITIGDQTLWAVYNDMNASNHTNNAGATQPLGIEVQQTTFAFDRPAPLGNMVFVKFKIFNKGDQTLQDCFVSLWSDPDLGDAADDLVGCDIERSLGFCYNATSEDGIYGNAPPAVGYDFFQGPIVPSPGDTAFVSGQLIPGYKNLGMTSFNKYINGTDPRSASQSYNYMKGLKANGDPLHEFDDPNQPITTYFVPGDPVTETGWLDTNEADRRLMLSSGPFTMAPGDSQEVVVAVMVAQGSDNLSSLTLLKQYDTQAQAVYALNFNIPPAPPRPTLWVRGYDSAIDLIWSTDAIGDVQISEELGEEYHFQGYNLYQGESIAGPWHKINTWDEPDSVALIYSDEVNVDVGGIERRVVQSGTNSGLSQHIRLTRDMINGGPIQNYSDYFYAITAYSYDVNHVEPFFVGPNQVGWLTPSLENSPQGITATPKSEATVLEVQADHPEGISDGVVDVAYVDQSQILEHDYEITFRENPDPETAGSIPFVWDLTDLTAAEVLLEGQTAQTEDYDDPVVNGFIPNVIGPAVGVKLPPYDFTEEDSNWFAQIPPSPDWVMAPDSLRWLSPIDFGCSGFGGGIGTGYGEEFWGAEIGGPLGPADYSNRKVQVYITSDQTKWTKCVVFQRPGYLAAPTLGDFPGYAVDIGGAEPRQLNISFIEMTDLPDRPANNFWDPSGDASTNGGREYLFIMDSTYDGDPSDEYGDDPLPGVRPGRGADVLIAAAFLLRATHTFLETDAMINIQTFAINTTEDRFTFGTYPAGTHVGTVVDNAMSGIRAVPNPYLNQSGFELNQFNRVIRFVNLPNVKTTIRLFTLNGDLIRTIVKDDPAASILPWDLQNDEGIPVASGIYIYHVDAVGIGTRVGKVAVFIEKERLNTF